MTDPSRDAALLEDYKRGGFMQRLAFGQRPALIVIDFVKAYLLEGSPLYGGEGIRVALRGAIELLGAARKADIPVFHTNLGYAPDGRNGGIFFRKVGALQCFVPDSAQPERGEFADGLGPVAGEIVITKQYSSAFFGTTLASTLTSIGVDTLIIAGVSTERLRTCDRRGLLPIRIHSDGGSGRRRRPRVRASRGQPFRLTSQIRGGRQPRGGYRIPAEGTGVLMHIAPTTNKYYKNYCAKFAAMQHHAHWPALS